MYNLLSLLGFFVLIGLGWLLSSDRKSISRRVILWSVILQLALGAFIFWFPPGRALFLAVNDWVVVLLENARKGSEFLFADLALPPGTTGSRGFYFAFQALPSVIFFAACTGLLYYCGFLPWMIRLFSQLFRRTMGTSGAESLSVTSNIFVGIEACLLIRPYLKKMTRSELAAVLTAGMATIASTVLGLYTLMLQPVFPTIAGHLVSASLISAPAAFLMAKLLVPETKVPETLRTDAKMHLAKSPNWIDAVTRASTDGLQLAFGIAAVLIAFLGLLALVNSMLGGIGGWFGHPDFKLELILSWIYYPLAWIIGIPAEDVPQAAALLGLRTVATEVPAYGQLAELIRGHQLHDPRTATIIAYALCGFAHVPSLGIFVGGMSALEPSRTADLGALGIRTLVAATLACLMTGAVAGIFYTGADGVIAL